MVTTSFLDFIPIWGMYLLTFLAALLAFELGYRYGIFQQKKSQSEMNKELDSMVSTMLGLFVFLMAFVVSMGVSRFDSRRQLVVAEATAIRTAYLQAGYLPAPYPVEIRTLLAKYVDLRLATFNGASVEEVVAGSQETLTKLWSLTESMMKENPARDELSLFTASMNEVINVNTRRTMAVLTSRLPSTIVFVLYLVAGLGMLMVGFRHSYAGKRNLTSTLAMILVFTVVMMLIIDLDRSQEGFLRVNQQAMTDLQTQIGHFLP